MYSLTLALPFSKSLFREADIFKKAVVFTRKLGWRVWRMTWGSVADVAPGRLLAGPTLHIHGSKAITKNAVGSVLF